ncbi:MAG: aldehyde ferredoxin oxidoreductase [Desulfobacteraceae bacterium]|jgi:aldehyde:ferredoxin oxidoreductase|nr:MAG: aldehyde ferredoxin oxidoreductase [Desulfobacteraceae bacterium]
MNRIVRIDMKNQEVREEKASKELFLLGGRSLIDKILTDEVDPAVHPLGEGNKLVFAPGLFAGTPIPNSGRLSIGAKSPLTGGIKESNGGGTVALTMARLGIKALVIEQRPENAPYILIVKKDSVAIEPAPELAMAGNYELCGRLREKYPHAAIASIGPCGEMKMTASTIALTDTNGFPSRHCGRGGLGAVMGSKGLKAVVLDDKGGSGKAPSDPDAFKENIKEVIELIKSNPRVPFFRREGTAGMIPLASARGSLPTRNHRSGSFKGFEGLSSQRMAELQSQRGGSMVHGCMPGCIVKCSNVYFDRDKKYLTSGFEYESLAMLGANLEIDDMDAVAAMERKCDDYGLDTIEVGAAIGVLGESVFFEFGNKEMAIDLVDQIGKGSPLGRVLGQGVATTCHVLGTSRVPAVKGQAIPAHCARSIKGVGVTYATSPQGADHTAGYVIDDNLSPVGQADRSRVAQINMMLMDSLGFCYFCFLMGKLSTYSKLIRSLYGVDCDEEMLIQLAKTALKQEKEFNGRAGLTGASDRMPEFLLTEPLPPTNSVFDVPQDDLVSLFDKL